MARSRKFLKSYAFLVPEGVWSTQDEFDADLARLFDAKGLDTEIMLDALEMSADRVISITERETVPVPEPPPTKKVTNFKALQKKRGFDGKFQKENT